jgi:hypothetical protein
MAASWRAFGRRTGDALTLAVKGESRLFRYEGHIFGLDECRGVNGLHTMTLSELNRRPGQRPVADVSVTYQEPIGRPLALRLLLMSRRAAVKELFGEVEKKAIAAGGEPS